LHKPKNEIYWGMKEIYSFFCYWCFQLLKPSSVSKVFSLSTFVLEYDANECYFYLFPTNKDGKFIQQSNIWW